MNCYSDNPNDMGIAVIGGTTGLGSTTQHDIAQKMESIQDALRARNPSVMDEYWNERNSRAIDELREKFR